MKRLFISSFFSVIFLSFIACDSKKTDNSLTIGMISDIGTIEDKSFNQNTWEGIVKFAKEHNIPKKNYSYANSATPEDYIVNLSTFADKKMDLIVTPGYYFRKAVSTVAPKYPNQKFLLIDSISDKLENVSSVRFAENEGSFLVGVATALKAKEMNIDKVGFIGGMDVPVVQSFEAGFIEGIKVINPNIKVFVEFANDFANPTKGQRIASKMFDKGLKIIFNVAGSTGNGIIKEAKKRVQRGQEVWVLGCDKDQYDEGIYKDDKSVVLTSMVKNLDVVVYDTLTDVKNGKFKSGYKFYTLKDNGVNLPKKNPNLKDEWLEIVKKYKDDIIKGKILVPLTPKRIENSK